MSSFYILCGFHEMQPTLMDHRYPCRHMTITSLKGEMGGGVFIFISAVKFRISGRSENNVDLKTYCR